MASLLLVQSAMATSPQIRVRIGKDQKTVKISGRDVDRMFWPTKSYKEFAGLKEFLFNCETAKKDKKYKKPIKLATIKSKTGSLKINDELYRGSSFIQTSENLEGCDIIMESSLDEYLATLLAKEMNAKWPIEALKAQAVAARSYAYFKMKTKQVSKTVGFETNYDIESSEKHQVSGSMLDATMKTTEASLQTKGEVLLDENSKIIPIFFHSKCGGKTLRPDQVWDNKVSGYTSVVCPFCHTHGMKNWVKELTEFELSNSLKKGLLKYQGVKATQAPYKIINDHKANSQVKMYAGDDFHVIKKSRLRAVLGRTKLPSNYFVINKSKNKYEVTGAGYGHGVGLCQFGAKELAKLGYTYKQILKHYFPKMVLKKIY